MLLLKTGPQVSLGSGPLAPANFAFACDDGLPAGWHVRKFELVEALSEPYRLSIELLTPHLGIDGEPALALLADQIDTRFSQDKTTAEILRDTLHTPLGRRGAGPVSKGRLPCIRA